MKSISTLVEKAGLLIEDSKYYNDFEIIIAGYCRNEIMMSKYLFVDLSSSDFNNEFLTKENYHKFEEEVLSPQFYGAKGDLGWNLYLICILTSDDYADLETSNVVAFEKNDKYVRKLVVKKEEFLNIIPIGKAISNDENFEDINPIEEWAVILENQNLEYCLEEFQNKKVDSFLCGDKIQSKIKKTDLKDKSSVLTDNNAQIKDLQITEMYRKHCYGVNKAIGFGRINLLSGANGSGKTSLLEAIELVMTGDVRKRNKSTGKQSIITEDHNSQIFLTMDDEMVYEIPKTTANRKKRESSLYQNRSSKYGTDALNSVFHRYNYFTFEEVFSFCYLGEQPDYKSEFTKVVFGEEIKTVEKNLNRHLTEFEARKKNLVKTNIDLKESIKAYDHIESSKLASNIDLNSVYTLLSQVNYTYTPIEVTHDLNPISIWLSEEISNLNSSAVLLNSVIENSNGYVNKEAISNELIKLETKFSNLIKDITDETKIANTINDEITKFKNTKITLNSNLKSIREKSVRLENLQDLFGSDVLNLNDIKKSNRIIDLNDNISSNEKEISVLKSINVQWGEFTKKEYKIPKEVKTLNNELGFKTNLIATNTNKLDNLDKDIGIKENVKGKIGSIITEVKALGEKYLTLSTKDTSCPMCGSDFKIRSDFEKALSSIENKDDDVLIKQYSERKNLCERNKQLEQDVILIEQQLSEIEEISNAIKFIESKCSIEISETPTSLAEKINIIKLALTHLDEKEDIIQDMKRELLLVEDDVYNYDSILRAVEFCNNYYNKKETYLDTQVIENLSLNLVSDINLATQGTLKVLTDIEELDIQISSQLLKYDEKVELIKNLKTNKTETTKDIKHLEGLNNEIHKVELNNIVLRPKDSFILIKSNLDKIIDSAEMLNKQVKKSISNAEMNTEVMKLQQKHDFNKVKIEICTNAINHLESLKPSSFYADAFIKDNIGDISSLFGSLHFPREFDSLGLNDDNEIIGYRASKGELEEVPIYLMSTGQRTAVVLSIFFKFYNSMKSVPRFILLDEPVSNIDDLNILALLDFLRELSLKKNCQIFFTTANTQVAKLFRRKFSFLRDDFYSYRFERNGNTRTKLIRDHFREFSDEAIQMESVFG